MFGPCLAMCKTIEAITWICTQIDSSASCDIYIKQLGFPFFVKIRSL